MRVHSHLKEEYRSIELSASKNRNDGELVGCVCVVLGAGVFRFESHLSFGCIENPIVILELQWLNRWLVSHSAAQGKQRIRQRQAAAADAGGMGRDATSFSGHVPQVRRRGADPQLPNEVDEFRK